MKFISLALAGAAGVLQAAANADAASLNHTTLAQVDECSAGRVPVAIMLHNVQDTDYMDCQVALMVAVRIRGLKLSAFIDPASFGDDVDLASTLAEGQAEGLLEPGMTLASSLADAPDAHESLLQAQASLQELTDTTIFMAAQGESAPISSDLCTSLGKANMCTLVATGHASGANEQASCPAGSAVHTVHAGTEFQAAPAAGSASGLSQVVTSTQAQLALQASEHGYATLHLQPKHMCRSRLGGILRGAFQQLATVLDELANGCYDTVFVSELDLTAE